MSLHFTCNRWTCNHRNGHQAEQEADSLGDIIGSDQLKGDGGHDTDEAAVKKPHQQAHSNQPSKDVAQRDHHGHNADDEEGNYLQQEKLFRSFTVTVSGKFISQRRALC